VKISKKLIIIIASVLVLMIGGGVVYATNSPTARAERQLNLGNKYLQEGKYQEAILAFEKVIQIEPKNIPARLGLGQVYVATKEFTKAEAVLKEVIQIDANNIPAREDLLKVYLNEGNLDSANSILQEMVKIDPNKDVKQLNADLDLAKAIGASKVSYDQGITQLNNKQYIGSVTSFQKVIKEDTERFSDAQTKIKDAKSAYIAQQLQIASDLVTATKYDEAIKVLDELFKIDATNEDAIKLKEQCNQAIAKAKADAEVAQAMANTSTVPSKEQGLQRLLNSKFFSKNIPGKFNFPSDKIVNKDTDFGKVSYYFIVYSGPLVLSSESKYLSMSYDHKLPLEATLTSGENIVINNYYVFRCLDLFTRHGSVVIDASNGKLYSAYNAVDTNFKYRLTFIE